MRKECIRDSLASTDWDAIAHAVQTLDHGVEAHNAKTRRLKVHVGLIRLLLAQKLRKFNEDNSIDLAFFISSWKSVRKLEMEYEANDIKKREYITLLKLLLNKLQKQKLRVKKTREIRDNFSKLKEVVENGHSII